MKKLKCHCERIEAEINISSLGKILGVSVLYVKGKGQ